MDARIRMVDVQIARRGISDARVLDAMREVPRHSFIPERGWPVAYHDGPVDIGHGQTISQPYIVAFMSEQLEVEPGLTVLEIGTGSGYQAAILAKMGADVYSIEIVEPLHRWARERLLATSFSVCDLGGPSHSHSSGIHLRAGDGYRGWPEAAPFDRIMVTAAPDHVPEPLKQQLKVGGRLILPVGDRELQELVVLEKLAEGRWQRTEVLPVLFVPMTGEAEKR